jgi:hypothetical protein
MMADASEGRSRRRERKREIIVRDGRCLFMVLGYGSG